MDDFYYLGTMGDFESKTQKLVEMLIDDTPGIVAVDTETISLEDRQPIGVGVAVTPWDAFYFPTYPTVTPALPCRILRDPSVIKVFHNAPFDVDVLDILAREIDEEFDSTNIRDTAMMAHLLMKQDSKLQWLLWEVGKDAHETAEELMKKHGANTMLGVPLEEVARHCCLDAMGTLALYYKWREEVDMQYLIDETKLVPILLKMSNRGIKIDQERRAELESLISKEVRFLRETADSQGFNPACLHPDSKILFTDLTWKPLSDVQVGDKLIGIEESPQPGKGKERRMQESIVEAKAYKVTDAYIISLDNDQFVVAGAEHPWLQVCKAQNNKGAFATRWTKTDELQPGMKIKYICKPWDYDDSREAGYIAGLLDGEGSLTRWHLCFHQVEGDLFNEYTNLLAHKGYKYTTHKSNDGNPKHQTRSMARVLGKADILRLLGSIRPRRLLAKSPVVWEGSAVHSSIEVKDIFKLPTQVEMIDIKTSTKTFIANGLLTHNSNQQVAYILAKRGNFLPFTRSKKSLATNREQLELIDDPIAGLVLNFREANHMLTHHIIPLSGEDRAYTYFHLDTITGRVTSTGSGSSTKSYRNLQNWKPGEDGVRSMLLPDIVFRGFDFSQIELRVLAHFSRDLDMNRIFDEEGDIHQETANFMDIPRRLAKNVNFSIIYGATPQCVMETARIRDRRRAEQLVHDWFMKYRGAADWIKATQESGRKHGYVNTLFGRKIRLPLEEKDDAIDRKASNYPIQGSAAEIMKKAMLMCKHLPLCLQIHDELLEDGYDEFPEGLSEIAPFRTPIEYKELNRWQ